MLKFIKRILKLSIVLALIPLISCSKEEKVEESDKLKVGMVVGAVFEKYIPDSFPESEIVFLDIANDLPFALDAKRVDVYFEDEYPAILQCKAFPSHKIIKYVHEDPYGFIFSDEREELRDEFNEYLEEITNNGRLIELRNIWLFSDDETLKVINYDELTGENGTLDISIAATMPPLIYVKDGVYVGYELALIEDFCKEYGYGIDYSNTIFSSVIASVTSGSSDMGAASITITDERKESILFSNPHLISHCVAVAREEDEDKLVSIDESNNKKIGVVTGALFDVAVRNDNPGASIDYYNYTSDLPIALDSDKLDGYAVDEPVAKLLCNVHLDHYIDKKLTKEDYGIIVNKNRPELLIQFNEYLASLKESGELLAMQDKWIGADENIKIIDFDSLSNNKETIKLATAATMQPFDYMKDGKYAGYEIDLIASFCKEYGYNLEIEDTNFAGVIASVSSGKTDFGTCVITITNERRETMNFTDPIYSGGIVLVKRKSQGISFDDYKGKTIGIQTGSVYDNYIFDKIPDVHVEYFNLVSDLRAALDAKKIDGFVVDAPVADLFINENNNRYKTYGSLHDFSYGIALPRAKSEDDQLYKQLNDYFNKIKQDGTLEEIYDIWTGTDESKKVIDYDSLPKDGEEVNLAVMSATGAPFVYVKDNQLFGYEVDIICRFCKEYGYKLVIDDYSIDGLFSALSAGKFDIGLGGMSITEERKEKTLLIDEQIKGSCVLVVKNDTEIVIEDQANNGIVNSFNKTFIREDRWKLFVSGVLTTVVITALSIILGTLLGFVVYMLYRNIGLVGQKIIDIIRNIVLKTPTVVVLMIIYYIIFGNTNIAGSFVSIIGLSILFANSVTGLLLMGVSSIDKGQMEAATTLGYSNNKAFIEIVLPQAILNVLSGYKSAIITLIKDSAIVGYIAVQDLTKVSDIIRSRTYEAFFPLISTAIIYYLIATIFIYLLGKLEFKFDPKKRKSIPVLKGVKTNDKD